MTKQKYLIILAVVIVVIAGYFIFFHNNRIVTKPVAGENIIIFGDSLAAGQGASANHDLASLIGQKTGLPTINAGRNGDTAITALPRLDNEVLNQKPKVVIILLGGNDFFQHAPKEQTMSSLTTIIDKIQATGAGVILINEDKLFATTPLFEKLAEDKKIPYIANAMGSIIKHKELMSDQIHPNDAGYEIFADKIVPVLLEYLK